MGVKVAKFGGSSVADALQIGKIKNIIEKLKTKSVMNKIINILEPIAMVIIILIVTAYLVDNSYNPFLYFRF